MNKNWIKQAIADSDGCSQGGNKGSTSEVERALRGTVTHSSR
jgi:hypothetical protein